MFGFEFFFLNAIINNCVSCQDNFKNVWTKHYK